MLEAIPLHWFSWDFSVTDRDQHIATIYMSWWREKGIVEIGNEEYCVFREPILSGTFILQRDTDVVALAKKPSVLTRRFDIEHAGLEFTLSPRHLFTRSLVLTDETGVVGTLSASSIFSRRMKIELPDSLPVSVKVFIVWLAVILWRRDANAASG